MLSQRLPLSGSYFMHPLESYKAISSGTSRDSQGIYFLNNIYV